MGKHTGGTLASLFGKLSVYLHIRPRTPLEKQDRPLAWNILTGHTCEFRQPSTSAWAPLRFSDGIIAPDYLSKKHLGLSAIVTELCQQVVNGTDACLISYGGAATGQPESGELARTLAANILCAAAESKRHDGALTKVTVVAQALHCYSDGSKVFRATTGRAPGMAPVAVTVHNAQQCLLYIRKMLDEKVTAHRHIVVTIELTVTRGHSHAVSRFTEASLAWLPPGAQTKPPSNKLWPKSQDMQLLNQTLARIDSSAKRGRVVAAQRVKRSDLPLLHAMKDVLHSQSHLAVLACVSPLARDAPGSAHCLHFARQFQRHVKLATKTEKLAQSKLHLGLLELYLRMDAVPGKTAQTAAAAAAGEISWFQLRETGTEVTEEVLFEVAAPDGLWFPFKTTHPLILPPAMDGRGRSQIRSRLTGRLLADVFEGRHLMVLAAGSGSKQTALADLMRVCTGPFTSLFTLKSSIPGWDVEVVLRVTDMDTGAGEDDGDGDSAPAVTAVCSHTAVSSQECEEVLGVATSHLANTVTPLGALQSARPHHRVVDLSVAVHHAVSGYAFRGSFCLANLATGPAGQYALAEVLAQRGGRPRSRNARQMEHNHHLLQHTRAQSRCIVLLFYVAIGVQEVRLHWT